MLNPRTVPLLVGLVYGLACITATGAVKCLSCNSVSSPGECMTVSRCGPHEICYSKKKVTVSGHVTWELGCRDSMQCSAVTKRDDSPSRSIRSGELSLCDECCDSDLCNRKQCGYAPPSSSGVLCYDCGHIQDPQTCGTITECGRDFNCSMLRPQEGGYKLGCIRSAMCRSLSSFLQSQPGAGGCTYCCDSDICNDVCSDIKTTTPATYTPPPTMGTRTSGLNCYSCDSQDTPTPESCQQVTQCGDNEACYMDEFYRADGSFGYSFGCRSTNVCSGSSPLVGKRAGQITTCSQCCQTDICQKTLCQHTGLKPRADRGPICYNCITTNENGTCNDVIECSRDKACVQSFGRGSDHLTYQRGCVGASVCSIVSLQQPSNGQQCFKCCLGDLCNVGCH